MAGLVHGLVAIVVLHIAAIVGIVGYELYHLTQLNLKYAVPEKDPSLTMRAMVYSEFGDASVIHEERIPQPKCCSKNEVKIRVSAAALNPVDFKQRRLAAPSFMRPLPTTTGFDFCGVVEGVGKKVKGFKAGDRVYGMLPLLGSPWGSVQEFVVADASTIAKAPKSMTCKEAASLPLVGLTVLQALHPVLHHWEQEHIMPGGQRILIQAGAGGVGTFAIQYAHHVLGLNIATTASPRNAAFLRDLGADEVIDYRSQRFENIVKDQDIVFDTVTQEYESRTLSSPTVLKQGGKGHYVNILSSDWKDGSAEKNPLFIMMPFLKKWAYRVLTKFGTGVHYHCDPVHPDGKGLEAIATLVDQKLLHAVVDKVFPFEQAGAAHEYLERGRTRGKVVIEVGEITE